MQEALDIRLRLLIKNVESLMKNGQDLLRKAKDAPEDSIDIKLVKIIYVKLRSAIDRFVTEMHHYFKLVQSPSADDLSSYTTTQIQAEEVVVELDLTFNLKSQDNHRENQSEPQRLVTSKLPKMELARFNGNILNWHTFWDQFESNIDNRDLKDVDKLLYLQSVLDGEAKRALEGLDITNKNYQIAVNTLKERFGKTSTVVDAHYTALYNIKAADKSVLDSRRAYNEIERHLRVLKSLGEDVNHNYLRVIIMQKFPENLIYELRLKAESDSYSIDEIRKQIECIISAKEASNRIKESINLSPQPGTSSQDSDKCSLEALHVNSEQKTSTKNNSPTRQGRGSNQRYYGRSQDWRQQSERNANTNPQKRCTEGNKKEVETKKMKPTCIFCEKGHFNDTCTEFKTIRERTRKLEGRCYNCLSKGHRASQCRSLKNCVHCGRYGKHNRALCPSKDPVKTENLHVNELNNTQKGTTVLQTAIAKVSHGDKQQDDKVFRILLDNGSQRSYVTNKVADILSLAQLDNNTLSVFTFMADRPNEIESPVVRLDLNTRTNNKTSIYANVVTRITNSVPSIPVEIEGLNIKEITPKTVILADDFSMGDQVDILIGNDYYDSLMSGARIKVLDNLYLVESIFGWVWSGRYKPDRKRYDQLSVLTYFQSSIELNGLCKPDLPLHKDDLRKLWDLESIGIMDSPTTSRDDEAITQFNATTKYYDNRYHVKWPWITTPPDLSTNLGLAHGRLISLLKRIDNSTIQAYDKILSEQLEQGIIEIIPDTSQTEEKHPIHYLPHHCIAKGDKLRLVYDASAKTNGHKSLNECLYRGPLLLKDLTGLLIRFREHRIAIVADVEKAFLQVGLQEEDRDVTRFLWLRNISQAPSPQNLLHLRFQRVPFGVISSPFLLNAVIRYHLLKNNKAVCRQIAEDLYVDNLVTGSDSVEDAMSLYSTARTTFNDLSMNLREWNSNSVKVMASIPLEFKSKELDSMKVLGLEWDIKNDSLSLRFELTKQIEASTVTKREMLRLIASIFDPCGYAAPLVLPAKLFLQTLWQQKIDWDTKFTEPRLSQCKSAIENLNLIKDIKIPRCAKMNRNPDETTSHELHVFTDASKQAYAAVVYLRSNCGSEVMTQIIIGKSRVANKSQQDDLQIPKLELLGAYIGAKLVQSVTKHTKLNIARTVLWTDSQIVINWCSTEKLLPLFVARRVEEIRRIANLQVKYVPTQLNPADIATRPNASSDDMKVWLNGPGFLEQDPKEWPLQPVNPIECNALTSINLGGQGPTETLNRPDEYQAGSANTQMIDDEHELKSKEPIDEEMVDVENKKELLVRSNSHEDESELTGNLIQIQAECYKDESKGVITDLGRSLGVYKDTDGLLRCKGRLCNTDWTYGQKHPILLPRNHEFTSKIIATIHRQNYHVGVPHTLSLVRKQYWIPKGRSKVQQVLRQCLSCRKHSGGPFKLPPMAPLPKERVIYSNPYTYTGLDYFGPFTVRNDGSSDKRWVCLYTCLAVRAIHMEVVQDLTSEECLLALRRFVAARGLPKLIISDNATTFKLTADILTSGYCIANNIKWKFIPELSPWFGGFYERLIGLVKHCLKRTIDKHLMNTTQLTTVIKEVEAVVNTRPLTTVDDEIDHILTPADFLCTGGIVLPDQSDKEFLGSATVTKADLIESWKRGQQILKEFIEMFSNRYLTSLRERRILHKQPRVTVDVIPQVGQLVQAKGSGSNRLLWKVGRISSLIKSNDGEIRVAKVEINPNETLTRSIAHLYPLEISDSVIDSHNISKDHDAQSTQVAPNEPNRGGVSAQLSSYQSEEPALNQLNTKTSDYSDQSQKQDVSAPNSTTPPTVQNLRTSRLSAQRARERVRKWTAQLYRSSP
ncbi:uncharacterized protein LOC133525496 [Cydia pomonella]|uniref:uncharacterized protein LOC133525496 n=1 Tax=Cydia pomonella TaxID=82600 RepID=UPI002ADDC1E2|nr:uncharacterized protein LOC133525496 [Cydia pomonella]